MITSTEYNQIKGFLQSLDYKELLVLEKLWLASYEQKQGLKINLEKEKEMYIVNINMDNYN